jgi:hypothetical protein
MSRAVVHDPKDAASRFIRLLPHDFAHKPIDGSNSTFDFTAAEDSCSMDIPGCQVGPGTHAEVLMLNVGRAIGRQRQCQLFSAAGLNTGLFVCADDVIIGTQWCALPDTLVKIEDESGFCSKVRIAGEDPASMFPGPKGITAEPAPQSSAADLSDQALGNNVLADFLNREPRQWEPQGVRKLASECLNLNDETGGKSGPYAHLEAAPQGQAIAQRRSAYATC